MAVGKADISYHYSSAKFYESDIIEFEFLNNLFKVFDLEVRSEWFVGTRTKAKQYQLCYL